MELYYLDNQFERGTQAILGELGCRVVKGAPRRTGPSVEKGLLEYQCEEDVTLFVTEGAAFVDLRDTADCWLRAKVVAGGPGLQIKADVFRRVQEAVKGIPTSIVQEGSSSKKEGNGKGKSAAAATAAQVVRRYANPRDAFDVIEYHKVRELTCELCRQFFQAGWVTGTGGSISIRHGNRIYMTPSGVQ